MAVVQRSLFDTIAAEGVHVNNIKNIFSVFYDYYFFSSHYGHPL